MIRIIQGDALTKLRELPSQSVRCCVTSPPYWGLRDYSACGCSVQRLVHPPGTIFGSIAGQSPVGLKEPDKNCPNCNGTGKTQGVSESQIGLEKTPEAYVAKLVEIFREVRRVLKNGGTLWLNLGDSYASDLKGSGGRVSEKQLSNSGSYFNGR